MDDSDRRYIFIENEIAGPYSLQKLMRMAQHGEINHRTLFWSERETHWLELYGILFDYHPNRIESMVEAGIEYIEVIGSGVGDDCLTCKSLHGVVFPIGEIPKLPPDDCSCIPWCRSLYIASEL